MKTAIKVEKEECRQQMHNERERPRRTPINIGGVSKENNLHDINVLSSKMLFLY